MLVVISTFNNRGFIKAQPIIAVGFSLQQPHQLIAKPKKAAQFMGLIGFLNVITQHPAGPVKNLDLVDRLHRKTNQTVGAVKNVRLHGVQIGHM